MSDNKGAYDLSILSRVVMTESVSIIINIRHSCASQVPTKRPYSVSNYIEESSFNAMEAGHIGYSDGLLPFDDV